MIKQIDEKLLDTLAEQARNSERKRAHYNLHASLDEDVHRLIMAVEPESVFPVQRHPDRWELMIILRGEVELCTYSPEGEVLSRTLLKPDSPSVAVELPPNLFHNMKALKPSVMLEVKKGPYVKPGPEDTLDI